MRTQIDVRKFQRKLRANGYTLHHMRGSHQIYRNGNSETIVINNKLNAMVAKKTCKGVQFAMKKRIYTSI